MKPMRSIDNTSEFTGKVLRCRADRQNREALIWQYPTIAPSTAHIKTKSAAFPAVHPLNENILGTRGFPDQCSSSAVVGTTIQKRKLRTAVPSRP